MGGCHHNTVWDWDFWLCFGNEARNLCEMSAAILPYPPEFPALLKEYCEQMGEAIRAKRHHDTRRHLFLNFLREAFQVDPVEVELEHKLKVGELRGRIDALYRHVIVEVKTDFDDERDDAQRELKKYFTSRPRPTEYIGIVTDGLPVVLTKHGDLVMINAAEALSQGSNHAYDWFSQTEGIWEKKRKAKEFTHAGWLNYHNKITEQNAAAEFIVIYNQSGTNIAASLVTRKEFDRIGELPIRGYVIDSKTYYHYPQSEEEGHYLVGILNTATVNEAIKPLQPQGLMGERDIHRRPFEACNIPLFDPKNRIHQQIAQVSATARAELLPVVPKMQTPVGTARGDARRLVQGKLNHLDELTRRLLGAASSAPKKPKATQQPELI
jgi:hypothetical protein